MDEQLLLGDEAVALAAVHAGIGGAFSYPGTPATEIMEHVQALAQAGAPVAARWSANEKVAYEAALGMSFIGRRALVSMKHVGLNVAADPFMSSALTGVNGGLVLAVGDDPGMHSSQNEQDTRAYAQFAQVPLLEPADPQQAYDMTRDAFALSERFDVPIVLRLVTRLAHARAPVRPRDPTPAPARPPRGRADNWTLLPPNARRRFQRLLDLQPRLEAHSSDSPYNRLELRGRRGAIATGVGANYFLEAAGERHEFSWLRIGAYPVPARLVRELVDRCDDVLVIEDGFPLVERQLLGLLGLPGKRVRGRLNGTIPAQGELTVDIVRAALAGEPAQARVANTVTQPSAPLPTRPPQLCAGCPHGDTYRVIVDAVGATEDHFYFSDIGCYTLAALPPYNAVDTCVEMGASIGMAIGAARGGAHPVVATIGDSTFIHSGMPSLVEAAHDELNLTVVILDNAVVGMTGGQEVFATGDELARIVLGLGVKPDHLVRIDPLPKSFARNVELVRREVNHRGLSVVIACRPCIHARRRATEHERRAAPPPAPAPAQA